jgi:hypothetical protein
MSKNKTINGLFRRLSPSKVHYLLIPALVLLLVDTARAFKPTDEFGHVGITRDGLIPITQTLSNGQIARFSERAIREIRDANAGVDDLTGEFFDQDAHCDNEGLLGCSVRILGIQTRVLNHLRDGNGVEARKQLGRALHTIQDFYAHSNWVNNPGPAHTDINSALGNSLFRGVGPNEDTCEDDFFDNELIGAGLTGITTGYFGSFEPPDDKCAHGVLPGVGIHKDNPGRPFFNEARALAVDATTAFVHGILRAVQDNDGAIRAFMDVGIELQLLGFVIDDTGSMVDDINGVKNSVTQIVTKLRESGRKPDQSLLQRFNDPLVPPPFLTPDPQAFLAAVNAIEPSGGGDCPELSQQGLLSAIGAAYSGSSLYFYSDASAKDAFLAPVVSITAFFKHIKINYILTDSCSSVDPAYVAGAQKTGGQVFSLRSDEIDKVFSLIEPSLSGDLQPLLLVNDTLTGTSKDYLIPIDSTITALTFSIMTDPTATMTVIRPTGEEIMVSDPDTTVTELSSGRIITIGAPATGIWHLQVDGEIGNVSASVMGNSPIQVNTFSFVELRGRLAHEGFFPLTGEPVVGKPLIARANVLGPFATVAFELRSEAGEVLQSIDLTAGGVDGAAMDDFVGSFELPREAFRVYAKGMDQNGLPFMRTFSPVFLGQTVEVTAGVSTAQIMPGASTTLRFHVTNLGVPDTFIITAMDDHGFVTRTSPQTLSLDTNATAAIGVDVTVPLATPVDTTVLLTVVAQSRANPAVSSGATTTLEVMEAGIPFALFEVKELTIHLAGRPQEDAADRTRVHTKAEKLARQAATSDGPTRDDTFAMRAFFTLGTGSDGIFPDREVVGLQIGTLAITIPAGAFKAQDDGQFTFQGSIDGVALNAVIQSAGAERFEFQVRGSHANLMGTANPVRVNLAIGDDSGRSTVIAHFGKQTD